MKMIPLILMLVLSFQVNASQPDSDVEYGICKQLYEKAEVSCTESMCEDFGGIDSDECVRDGDFYEGMQICMEEALPEMIQEYNEKNPQTKVNCIDMDF